MKLRLKISLVFGVTVLLAIMAVGSITISRSRTMATTNVSNNMVTNASLGADQITNTLTTYLDIAEVTGEDPILSGDYSDAEKVARMDELAEEYEFTSGNILDSAGVSLDDGTDFSDRAYVTTALAGEANISSITLSKYTNTYGFSIAAPLKSHDSEVVSGVVYFRMDITFMQNIISKIKMSDNSYAYIIDSEGQIIVHENADLITTNVYESSTELAAIADTVANGEGGSTQYNYEGTAMMCGYYPISGTDGWTLIVTGPASDFTSEINSMVTQSLIVDVIALIIAFAVAIYFASSIARTTGLVEKSLVAISNGDFSTEITKTSRKDEIGVLQNAAESLQADLKELIGETKRVLGDISNCDLSSEDMKEFTGEFNDLTISVNSIKEILGTLISEVQESASSVGVGSSQLADAADALSRGTVSQASSIDQVVVDVQDVTDRIQRNSDNESMVENKLKNLEGLIGEGNDEMTELVSVVKDVEEMSNDIQKIVGTIDSIAFQTNILALNASVEAARAGDNGKGFAVVADEVGALAAKTSEASKQTSELIGRCIERIQSAMNCAETTNECLKKIVDNSAEISEAFEEIAHDTRQQASKSANIRQEMDSISDVVQTNTATAQETAAATEELSTQAKSLSDLISKFRI